MALDDRAMKHSNFKPVELSSATTQQFALVNIAFAGKVPALWTEFAEQNFVVLRASPDLRGVSDDSLAMIAANLVRQLASSHGGTQPYIPVGMQIAKGNKYDLIAQEFNGKNFRELAKKYEVSESRIRQIVIEQANLKKSSRIAMASKK